MGALLASLVSLWELYLGVLTGPDVFSPHLLTRTRSRIGLFRLKERRDREPAISSVCHRRSLGLLNPCWPSSGANDAFGLAFAPDRLTDVLGNVPRPLAFGLDANLGNALVVNAFSVAVASPPDRRPATRG